MSRERINSIDMRIKNLNQEATNLKTSQNTGWDSIRAYKIETTNEFDFDYTPTFTGGQTEEGISFYAKFTADHQDAPFAKMVAKVWVGNSAWFRVGHWSEDVSASKDNGLNSNGWVWDVYGNYSPTGTPNKKNELSWYNSISVHGQINIKVKFIVYATDTGRLVVKYEHNDGEGFAIQ